MEKVALESLERDPTLVANERRLHMEPGSTL